MRKRVKAVLEAMHGWIRTRRERSDPEYRYLCQSTDLVDLEQRMRALRNGEVRGISRYISRGLI